MGIDKFHSKYNGQGITFKASFGIYRVFGYSGLT
jgi:hypothetical protein